VLAGRVPCWPAACRAGRPRAVLAAACRANRAPRPELRLAVERDRRTVRGL